MLIFVLLLIALVVTIVAGVGRCPLWPAVLVLVLADLVAHWPGAVR